MFIATECRKRDFGVGVIMSANNDTIYIIALDERVPIGINSALCFPASALPVSAFLDAIAITSTASISENFSAWRVPVPPDPIIPILIVDMFLT